MSKVYVTYGCGHTIKANLSGTIRAREKKLDWMNNNLCPNCYCKQKKMERTYESIKAAESAVALGFPPLLGIPSQISLANTIRQKHYERVCFFFSGDKLRSFKQLIMLETYAKWWIDNRVLDIDFIHKALTGTHAGIAAFQTNLRGQTEQIPAQPRKKSVIME